MNFQPRNGNYTVGDFMTKKDNLHVVKPTTTVDEGMGKYWGFILLNILKF